MCENHHGRARHKRGLSPDSQCGDARNRLFSRIESITNPGGDAMHSPRFAAISSSSAGTGAARSAAQIQTGTHDATLSNDEQRRLHGLDSAQVIAGYEITEAKEKIEKCGSQNTRKRGKSTQKLHQN